MRIKAYFCNKEQEKEISESLGWWDHFDTYGADIMWDKREDHFIIHGSAVNRSMAKAIKKFAANIEIEEFRSA